MENCSTILLVEDSRDDVLFFERALRESRPDYNAHVAGSAEAAISYLKQACQGGEVLGYPVPRFLIMDSKLQGSQGGDLLQWMFKHSVYSVVPTVVLSGSARPLDVQRAFELGVHGYFVKPATPGDLIVLLKMIFHYWAQSCVPPLKRFEFTEPGTDPVLKKER